MSIRTYVCLTGTPTPTKTPTTTKTPTQSQTPSQTYSSTPDVTTTQTPTRPPTPTPTPTTTYTRTPTQTRTQTPTYSRTSTNLPVRYFEGPFIDPDNPDSDGGTSGSWVYCAQGNERGEPQFIGSSFADGAELIIEPTEEDEEGNVNSLGEFKTNNYDNITEEAFIDGEVQNGDDIKCPKEANQNVITLEFPIDGKFRNSVKIPFYIERIEPDPPPTPSITPSYSPTLTPSMTHTITPSLSLSMTQTMTPTQTISQTPSSSQTPTPSISITPSITVSISVSPSEYHSCKIRTDLCNIPTPSPTPSISITPTQTASNGGNPVATPQLTASNADPTPTPSTSGDDIITIAVNDLFNHINDLNIQNNSNSYAEGRIQNCPTPTPTA